MLLPNGKRAIVDIRKLRDYCLNPDHPRGSRKARVFRSALGMTKVDAPALRRRLLQIAASEQAHLSERDEYGQRYTIDFELRKGSRRVTLRSGWVILTNETAPRLTTRFVKKGKR
ncbi:MAG TPA: hypothetical protein VFU31_10395 [Candidatus Binatia bacterium]|nr:hypothetical protein [Candidatus Binatia bacterium]